MLLAIDAGNTNIVFSAFSGPELAGSWRAMTRAERTADEYAAYLLTLFNTVGINPDKLRIAIISSVVPDANFALQRLCEVNLGIRAFFIGDPLLELGIKVRIDRPEELGADRIVNAIGALQQHKPPFLIADFGTATTLDYIDAKGDYCGGVIAPGPNLSLQALHMAAAKLPRVALTAPAKVLATNTVGAMQSGVFYGYLGMVEGLVQRLQDEVGQTLPVIATGGLASLFAPASKIFTAHEPDLTLRGLKYIYDRNAERLEPL